MDVLFQKLLREYKQSPTDDLSHRIVGWVIRGQGSADQKITHAVVDDVDSEGEIWSYGHVVKYEEDDTLLTLAIKTMLPCGYSKNMDDDYAWTEKELHRVLGENEHRVLRARVAYLLTQETALYLRSIRSMLVLPGSDTGISWGNYCFQQVAKSLCVRTLEKKGS